MKAIGDLGRARLARWRPVNARGRSWAFLAVVAAAEMVVAWVNPLVGLSLHALLLLGWIPLVVMEPNRRERDLMLGLILAPLIRLVSLALPLHLLSPLASIALTAIPLYVAAWKVSRIVGLPAKRLGLEGGNRTGQYVVGLGGIVIGVILFQVLAQPPLTDTLAASDPMTAALVLVVFAGFIDELIFRGLLQSLAYRAMGSPGPLYVAFVYAAMQIGYRSAAQVLAALGLGLVFGTIAHRSRSIMGVSLAHGLANIVVYLVMPVMQARFPFLTSDMAPAAASRVVAALPLVAGAIVAMVVVFIAGRLASMAPAAASRPDAARKSGL